MAYRNYGPNVQFVVNQNGHGDFRTIGAALTAATAGHSIYINDGTYTENITGKAGVSLVADLGDSDEPNVTIIGKISFSSAGTFTVSNCKLTTNSDFFLEVTGSAASVVQLRNCFLNALNNTGINFTTSNAASAIACLNCAGNIATTGITAFVSSSTGVIQFIDSTIVNTGASTTASTISAGTLAINWCSLSFPITTSGTSQIVSNWSQLNTEGQNVTTLTSGGSGNNQCISVDFQSGSASSISIGSNLTLIDNCSVGSSNTNAITGAGTLNYTPISFTDSSATVNTSTQVKLAFGPGAFVPGGITFDNVNVLANFVAKTAFTPTLAFGGASVGITYATRVGFYQRIGNQVSFALTISLSSKGSSVGTATITGLPLTSSNDANDYVFPMLLNNATVATGTYFCGDLAANSSTITLLFGAAPTGAIAALADTNLANNSIIRIEGFYYV